MEQQKVLVTGGAGFIGVNTCERLLGDGHQVVVLDNLSRRGGIENLRYLQQQWAVPFIEADVRDAAAMQRALEEHPDTTVVLHLAGQVAVTTSVSDPRQDFEINALGTFNVLEAVRLGPADPMVIYASTNKVYGGLEDLEVEETPTRYQLRTYPEGIPETRNLDFHSPYGCSKGAADQYVRDYARIYDLPAVVMRQSCIYGPRQFGIEDQGWLAWFIIAALLEQPITIFGDGKQVRDVLYVDDLVEAYLKAMEHRDLVAGRIYNLGGGPSQTMSVWAEFGELLTDIHGAPLPVRQADWRPGDQPVYVSDIRRARAELDWEPQTPIVEGVRRLYAWVRQNEELIRRTLA